MGNFQTNARCVRSSTSCGRNGLGGLVRHPEGGGKLMGEEVGGVGVGGQADVLHQLICATQSIVA